MNFNNTRLPLKRMYYILFVSLIVIPLLIVLLAALLVLNQRFKEQEIENIKNMQESILTELLSDVETLSLRLSHLVHTNNNEMLDLASYADIDDMTLRYEYLQKLQQSGSLALEPTSNLVSVGFYMKGGKQTYIKNDMVIPQIETADWYQQALQDKNQVYVGSYHIVEKHEAYAGSRENSMLLIFALAPDRTTDRNEKIEMVAIYYATDIADKLLASNKGFLNGKNSLGMMQIVDEDGRLLYSPDGKQLTETNGDTCIRTPIDVNNAIWYVESYIQTDALTSAFWQVAGILLAVAVCIFVFAGYFSRYLIKGIVRPIEEISDGLKQVEDGNLDVYIASQGQAEIRNMILQFNAMVRRLRTLIGEYEQQVRNAKVNPADYLAAMLRREMTPKEVAEKNAEFFADKYVLLGIYIESKMQVDNNAGIMAELLRLCERNPRFAAKCIVYVDSNNYISVFYKVIESEYSDSAIRMVQEIQREVQNRLAIQLSVCISRLAVEPDDFYPCVDSVKERICFRHLYGENAIVDFNRDEELLAKIEKEVHDYDRLAEALYIADEKNTSDEKERIFAAFINRSMEEIKISVLAAILAIGNRFSQDNSTFAEVFGQQNNYIVKIDRINELRSMKLWLTNYCAWILNYSAAKLKVSETDVIIKAKRYITEHCEEAELSLAEVAEYVGLNEKYFTNRFTKEAGETFSSYLTALRMQKARELLKTSTFKIYEISEMVGYRNVEHFNRVFKKMNNMTPAQYRKTM